MRKLWLLGFVALAGCASSAVKENYKAIEDPKNVESVVPVENKEDIIIYTSSDLSSDILMAMSKRFIPIGISTFTGEEESVKNIRAQAKKVGAAGVLVNTVYKGSDIKTSPFYTSQNGAYYNTEKTTTYVGDVSLYRGEFEVSDEKVFDQAAVFFVKTDKEYKFGLFVRDVTKEVAELLDNSGVLITVVVEGTPAAKAGIVAGDVLIKIEDVEIRNTKQYLEIAEKYRADKGAAKLTVIRDGEEKVIDLKLSVAQR